MNSHLLKRQLRLQDLFQLCDGVLFIQFLECLTGLEFRYKFDPKPTMRIQKIQNVSIVLQHISSFLDIKLVNCGPEDIVDQNEKMLLGLLYSLYVKYNIRSLDKEGQRAEEILLNWVKDIAKAYGVDVSSYGSSFTDGRALLALVDAFVEDKDKLDYSKLVSQVPVDTIEAAFRGAADHMGIPRLIDPKILASGKLDERSMVLIVSSFHHAFKVFEKQREQERRLREIQAELMKKTMSLEEAEAELLKRAKAIEDASQELERTKRELDSQLAKTPPSEIWSGYLKNPGGLLPAITIPFSLDDAAKKFTAYHIKITLGSKVWVVAKRYSEVDKLASELQKEFGKKVVVPKMPPKKPIGKMNPEFVAQRKTQLQQFLQEVVHLEPLLTSQPFAAFISKNSITTLIDVESFKKLQIEKYKMENKKDAVFSDDDD